MLGSRRGRPSLIGRAAQTAARTAVITATASTVANRVQGGGTAAAAPQPMPVAPPPQPAPGAPPAGGLTEEGIARLKQLAELHSAGILTEAEFAEQKARLLA
jgi:hypothetical protein